MFLGFEVVFLIAMGVYLMALVAFRAGALANGLGCVCHNSPPAARACADSSMTAYAECPSIRPTQNVIASGRKAARERRAALLPSERWSGPSPCFRETEF